MSTAAPKVKEPIIIVGAGWSGLTTAFCLSRAGFQVKVLEAAPQSGGRARSISFKENRLDNGQHLLVGAYSHILKVLDWLNIPEETVFYRLPFKLLIFSRSFNSLQFLKSPFSVKGLSLLEQFKLMQFFFYLKIKKFRLPKDSSVLDFLRKHKQPERLIKMLWEPITLAALSTPIDKASAQVFLFILKQVFKKPKEASDWLFPKVDLSEILPGPINNYLNNTEKKVFYHERVQNLLIEQGRCIGVKTHQNKIHTGSTIVLATPIKVTAKLIENEIALGDHNSNTDFYHEKTKQLVGQLQKFSYEPITTIYLCYPFPVNLKYPMIGLQNHLGQWIFDRKITGQANILSIVITSNGAHNDLTHDELKQIIIQELITKANDIFCDKLMIKNQDLENPLDFKVITEKQAAYTSEVGIEDYRPSLTTAIPNLWITGDYTQKGYPATLEAAVRSGIEVSELIISQLSNEQF